MELGLATYSVSLDRRIFGREPDEGEGRAGALAYEKVVAKAKILQLNAWWIPT